MKFIFSLLAAICAMIAASILYDMTMKLVFNASDFTRGLFALLCVVPPGVITFFAMIWDELPKGKTEKEKMWQAYLAGDHDSEALQGCAYDMRRRFEKWYQEITEQQ